MNAYGSSGVDAHALRCSWQSRDQRPNGEGSTTFAASTTGITESQIQLLFGEPAPRTISIDFDVERPYDRRPFDDFILDKTLKLRRRGIQIWNKPCFNQHILIIRICERIVVCDCNSINYRSRRPRS
jgi:hypothetical protein